MSLKKLTEEYNDAKYNMEVSLDITRLGVEADIEHNDKVDIAYVIALEYKSWGINNIDLVVDPISLSYVREEDGKEIEIVVEPEIEWISGKQLIPSDLDVYLEKDGSIREATLNVYFIDPTI